MSRFTPRYGTGWPVSAVRICTTTCRTIACAVSGGIACVGSMLLLVLSMSLKTSALLLVPSMGVGTGWAGSMLVAAVSANCIAWSARWRGASRASVINTSPILASLGERASVTLMMPGLGLADAVAPDSDDALAVVDGVNAWLEPASCGPAHALASSRHSGTAAPATIRLHM